MKKKTVTLPIYTNNSKISGIILNKKGVIRAILTSECPGGGAHDWQLSRIGRRVFMKCSKCGKEDDGS